MLPAREFELIHFVGTIIFNNTRHRLFRWRETKRGNNMKPSLLSVALTVILGLSTQADANNWRSKSDARLTIAAPESTFVREKHRDGIKTLQYRNKIGALSTTQWPLILRFESRTAVGFAASVTAQEQKRESLVLRDPDGCLNLASLVDDLMLPAFDPDCAGLAEDETYIEVQTEKYDTFELVDNRQTGNDFVRERLVDDVYMDSALLNTPYLALKQDKVTAVGPKTGGPATGEPDRPELDGYGFGADDDFVSLVILVDIGGARVFDLDFNHVPGVIRNIAGFVNVVSAELLDGKNQTAITATMHPLAGLFEPIAVFDFSVTNPDYAGFDYLQRVDSGPITAFKLIASVPEESDPPPKANEFYDEILSTYYPTELKLRAVIVARQAPAFIHDLNYDGRFTAQDVKMAGYELLSNEVEINLTVTHDNLLIESPDIKCLPRTVIFDDLDGNGKNGEPFKCSGKSGSGRSRRVPR